MFWNKGYRKLQELIPEEYAQQHMVLEITEILAKFEKN